MPIKANVLVTATGSIVAQGIIKSLKLANMKKESPVSYKIIATDMNAQAAGLYRSDVGVIVPQASSPEYVDSIIKVCKDQNIVAIFIGSDEELLPLCLAKDRIKKEACSFVITNPVNVLRKAMDKWKTFVFLKKNNLPCPETSLPKDQEDFVHEFGFPVVIKPREGHGSVLFHVAHNKDEVTQAIKAIQRKGWRPILQEFLDGENSEYTSGLTVDNKGKKVMSSITMRRTIKSGQTYKAFIDVFGKVRKSAEEIAMRLGARGAVNIQAKLVDGIPKVFEINPRFSATSPLRAVAGVNEPDIVFRNVVMSEDIEVRGYQKLVCMRYWNEVYLPLPTFEKTAKKLRVENADSFVLPYF
jgi:carbamoyl-phosphate synthase large subunit